MIQSIKKFVDAFYYHLIAAFLICLVIFSGVIALYVDEKNKQVESEIIPKGYTCFKGMFGQYNRCEKINDDFNDSIYNFIDSVNQFHNQTGGALK